MNKRGAYRCEFCNSASHTMYNCNSNMNGLRESLDKNGWNCMMDPVCPKFHMLAANHLRYIAYHYAKYEKAIYCSNQKTTQRYNQKFRLRPIPLTLSKKQMVHALTQRWNGFQTVRDLYNSPPTQADSEDCPICLESLIGSYDWSYETSSWKKDCVTTVCKHQFCKECWKSHIERNSKYSLNECNHQLVGIKMHVCCPMCRHKILV